jgi:hypothetical protein
MKRRNETYQEPVTRYRAIFSCDHCSFESDSGPKTESHEARAHRCKKESFLEGIGNIYHFDKQEDFTFHQQHANLAETSGYGEWKGPGWYTIDYGSEYWSGGESSTATYILLANKIEEIREEAQKNLNLAAEAGNFLATSTEK